MSDRKGARLREGAGVEPNARPPATIYRPLFPDRVRQADLLTLCKGLARFVRLEGYWPNRRELAKRLGSDFPATVDGLNALITGRHVERLPIRSGIARFRLTTRGWELLGIAPIEPWRRVPSKALLRRTINAAASRILKEEHVARESQS